MARKTVDHYPNNSDPVSYGIRGVIIIISNLIGSLYVREIPVYSNVRARLAGSQATPSERRLSTRGLFCISFLSSLESW